MARKIALGSWVAFVGILIFGFLWSALADVEGRPILTITALIAGLAFCAAIGATLAWVLGGVHDLTKPPPKKPTLSE